MRLTTLCNATTSKNIEFNEFALTYFDARLITCKIKLSMLERLLVIFSIDGKQGRC